MCMHMRVEFCTYVASENAFVFTDVVHVQVHSRCNGMRSTVFIHEYACIYNGAHARMYISDIL